jgi:hypothetical protein
MFALHGQNWNPVTRVTRCPSEILRRMRMRGLVLTLFVVSVGCFAVTAATASALVDLFNGGDLHEGVGQADSKSLTRGVTYTAKSFPLGVRIRPPDSLWEGVQLQSGKYRFVQLLHLKSGSVAFHGRGFLTLETSTGRTPSVATTIQHLRANPALKATPVTPARVAGYVGKEFDASVVGDDLSKLKTCPGNQKCPAAVSLAPFLANGHCGFCGDARFDPREAQDVKVARTGQVFRFIALKARGKTVVIYLESATDNTVKGFPGSATFPSFVPFANKLLSSLRFRT